MKTFDKISQMNKILKSCLVEPKMHIDSMKCKQAKLDYPACRQQTVPGHLWEEWVALN